MSFFSRKHLDYLAQRLAELLLPRIAARLTGVGHNEVAHGLCDQKEAEQILGVSRSTFYRLIEAGVVRRLKVGRSNRYDRVELLGVVEKMRLGEIDLSGGTGE